jgi:hypothetical protein
MAVPDDPKRNHPVMDGNRQFARRETTDPRQDDAWNHA